MLLERMCCMNSVSDVWKKVIEILSKSLTPVAVSTWFDDCRAIEIKDNRLVLCTPSIFKKKCYRGALPRSDKVRAERYVLL